MKKEQQSVCMSMNTKVLNPVGIYSIPLPKQGDCGEMSREFHAAPQFSKVNFHQALQLHKGKLRVILVGNDDYSKRQCAMYLTMVAEQLRKSEECAMEIEDRWTSLDYEEEETENDEMSESLAVLPDILVDPKCSSEPTELPPFPLQELECKGAIVEGTEGNHMTYWGATAFLHTFQEEAVPHVFLSVTSEQMTGNLSKELQLRDGFTVCHIGSPTEEYLEEVFWTQAEKYYPKIRENTAVDGKAVVKYLKHLRGKSFSQKDIESCVQRSFPLNLTAETLTTEHFSFAPTNLVESASGRQDLDAMLELEEVKNVVERLLAMDKLNRLRGEKGLKTESRHRHMAFDGAPGTGKTVTAQILAKILHEEGVGTGCFKEAGKEDLVGRFVGHTAPKVAKLFEEVRGGVLFLDEIGALVQKNQGGTDNFAEEAINALVYHMDRNPETVVIFATYTKEMDEFLDSNPGLSSRVAQRLHFPSYSKSSLLHILEGICEKQGYTMEKKAITLCGTYLQKLKDSAPRTFGNGREVRRIFNAAEEEMAVRLAADPTGDFILSYQDMKKAVARLEGKKKEEKRIIGFAV